MRITVLLALIWIAFIFFYMIPRHQAKRVEAAPARRKPRKYK